MATTWIYATLTSIGTSTTETQLNGTSPVSLPESARSIRRIMPITAVVTPTAAETVIAQITLKSDDFPVVPYNVLAPIAPASLAKAGFCLTSKTEMWPVNANVSGGAKLNVYGTALVANTAAPYLGCAIEVSTHALPGIPRTMAKLGTVTSTGTTAAATVAGTAYTFTGGTRLKEVYGVVVPATVAAVKPCAGHFKIESTEFDPNVPVTYPFSGPQGALSTDATTPSNIQPIINIAKFPCDIGIKKSLTRIQDYCVTTLVSSSAGNFITGILYT